jgi:tRNA dimethylallyltransferase
LIYDFDIPKVPANEALRKKLEKEAKLYWNDYVYEKLKQLDPEYAKELHSNNLNYVIRAIEVKTITWKSKKDFRKEKSLKYDILFLTPYDGNREELYSKINLRVQKMFDDWLVDEVKGILDMWYKKTDFWLKTIWYKEVIEYLDNKMTKEECIDKVKQFNRNYAKRQLTWFSKYNLQNCQ